MGFLGHNFGSRHARGSIKGSIDVGDHVVSKHSFSQNLACPGPVKVGQKFKNTLILGAPSRRTPNPNQKNFLIETRRLAASVESLNSSLAIAAGEL